MSKSIKINGAIYDNVDEILIPKSSGDGYHSFVDASVDISRLNVAQIFAGTATEINDINGEVNGAVGSRLFRDNDYLEEVILPAVTSTNAQETFAYSNNLKYVEMDSCQTLSYRSFRECNKLEEVVFPSLTYIPSECFHTCTSLHTYSFPLVTYVDSNGLNNCDSLVSLSLPSCTSLGGASIANCDNLEEIIMPNLTTLGSDFSSGSPKLISASFPNVNSLGEFCFRGTYLKNVSLPSVTGELRYRAFRDATRVESVTLNNIIGTSTEVFYNCTSLQTATFQKLRYISGTAFYNCRALQSLILGNRFATLSNVNAFTNSSIALGTGYVYVGLYFLRQYRHATNWSNFAVQILPHEMLEDNTLTEYNISFTLPSNFTPKIHLETSKCELDCNGKEDKIIVGDDSDTLQYSVTCNGFVPTSGSISITNANTNITIDLSNMQTDSNFNGFSIINLDFEHLPVNLSNYATVANNGFQSYENYHDLGGIDGFTNANYVQMTTTLPNYSGMTNPVFLWETIVDITGSQTGGNVYSMGGSNSGGGTIYISQNLIQHYAAGIRFKAEGLELTGKHHVALACTATTVYLYIDGELIGSYSDTNFITGMTYTTPRVGNNQSAADQAFDGKICNVCQTVRDISDPSVYSNCGFLLQIPQD